MALITRVCIIDKSIQTMEIPRATQEKVDAWLALPRPERPLVQDAFPILSTDEREFILSGITPQMWEDLFGEEE